MARSAVQAFGRVDTWVNNAGVSVYGHADQVSIEDARRLFDTNVWGVVNGSLEALPLLRRSGGALIKMGGELSEIVIALQSFYCASKHAVKGFTDALRLETGLGDDAPVGITLIQPTATDTPFPQHARNYMDREPKLPTPLIGPERVAEAILHAATDGGRDVKVGALAHVSGPGARLMPRVADRVAAWQARRQQHEEAPRLPTGNLYASNDTGRIHGESRVP